MFAKKIKTDTKRELLFNYYMQNEFPGLSAVTSFSGQRASSVYLDSTAVRIPGALYQSATTSNVRLRSEEFLLNCRPSSIDLGSIYSINAYSNFEARASAELSATKDDELFEKFEGIELPAHRKLRESFDLTVRSRRSRRTMSGKPLDLEELSTLLFYANGVTGEYQSVDSSTDSLWPTESLGEPSGAPMRTTASAGGLYPIHLFLVLQKVKGLADGLYRYLPMRHALAKLPTPSDRDWGIHQYDAKLWGDNVDMHCMNVAIFYVYDLYRNSRKYGDFGMNFALIETGMIAGHVHLAASAMDLASTCLGGSNKVLREKFLGIDGLSYHLIHLTIVGRLDR